MTAVAPAAGAARRRRAAVSAVMPASVAAAFTAIAAWLHRRVHRGTSTSGVLSQRVQALHGLEWRAKTLCLRSAKRLRTVVAPMSGHLHPAPPPESGCDAGGGG